MDASHTNARLAFEGDGWVAYTPPNQRYAVRIHLSEKPGISRWVVDELHYSLPRITARDLRDLPLGKVEAWVNQLVQQGLVDVLGAKLSDAVQFADPLWVPKLPPTSKGPKGDEFYRWFGEIYGKAAVVSTQPAKDLAEAWDKPITTIHRWTREARRRGHLPPAEPGRRG
jgi:hypothetical protein